MRIAVLLVLAAFPAACRGEAPTETRETGWSLRPGEHRVLEQGATGIWAGQVVAEDTGAPVPGCRVRVFSEIGRVVLDGRGTLLGEGSTDEDGFATVLVRLRPPPSHFLFTASGRAPRTEFRGEEIWKEGEPAEKAVVRLPRGKRFSGRVVDPLGRPCPGVRVSAFEGCGHAPAMRRTVTDGGGRFAFECLDVERLWIEGPGIAAAYADWLPDGRGGALVLAEFGVTAKGRVLSRTGEPLPGVWVRGQWARGPGVRTDAEGRFSLEGLEAGSELRLSTDRLPEKNGVVLATPAATILRDSLPLTLRFDPGDASMLEEEEDHLVTLTLPGGPGANRVALIRRETGQAFEEVYEGDAGTVEVPAGSYQVRVGGPFRARWLTPFEAEFRESGPLLGKKPRRERERARLRIVLRGLLPNRLPEWSDGLVEWDWTLFARLRDGSGHRLEVGDRIRRGEEIPVPTDTPLALLVYGGRRPPVILPIAPVPALAGKTTVRELTLPAPIRLRFRLAAGRSADGLSLRFLDADLQNLPSRMGTVPVREIAPGEFEAASLRATARALLMEDEEAGTYALLELPSDLGGAEAHDLGTVSLRAKREVEISVRDDRGRPVDGVRVLLSPGEGAWDPEPHTPDASEDTMHLLRTRPVRRILVTGPDLWTHERKVEGWGPFRIVAPSSSVTVKLPAGDPAGAWGYLDGRPLHLDGKEGVLRLRGVPEGLHRLKVRFPDGRRRQRVIRVGKAEDRKM